MHSIRLAAFTFVVFTGTVVSTSAQSVIYNSFGPGNTYDSGVVWAVSGASTSGGYRAQAEFFTPGISGYLNTIELATYRVSGSPLSNFFITQDSGGGSPGAILETFSNVTNPSGLLTLHSTPGLLLQAGTEYWLCDEPATATSYNGWYENSQNMANGFAYERSEWDWSPFGPPAPDSGVFEVTVTPVPEPSIFQLAAIGGCCSLVLWRYRKNDFRRGRGWLAAH